MRLTSSKYHKTTILATLTGQMMRLPLLSSVKIESHQTLTCAYCKETMGLHDIKYTTTGPMSDNSSNQKLIMNV